MSNPHESTEINRYIKEYLLYLGLHNTADCLEAEIKQKQSTGRGLKMINPRGDDVPRLYALLKNDGTNGTKTKREINLENEMRAHNAKNQQVLQAGRQIFSVSINLFQILHQFRETAQNENLSETLENYKIQLGKYNKVIINEGKPEGNELITETVMLDHKTKLFKHYKDQYIDGMIEVLLSLRVNALQIAPELRKNLVYELIRNDIFNIQATDKFDFIIQMLDFGNQSLRHAVTSLVSVVSSTLRGVEYLTHGGAYIVVEKIVKILKEQENGSVTQRFCLAILQKSSIKESVIPVLVEQGMIEWVVQLIRKSLNNKIHVFCLDFASAMLANITHTPSTLVYFESHPNIATQVRLNAFNYISHGLCEKVHGEFVEANAREYPSFCVDAHFDLLDVHVEGLFPKADGSMSLHRSYFRVR